MDPVQLAQEEQRFREQIAVAAEESEQASSELYRLQGEIARARQVLVAAKDEEMLQEVGIYAYHHQLADSLAYRTRLDTLQSRIKTLAKNGHAVQGATNWTVNNSASQGTKMVREFSKLMLRAYNAEVDQCVRTIRPYKLNAMIDRLYKSRETIARLGSTMQIRITDQYHDARIEELKLTADYLQKKDEEKEEQREIRARAREDAALEKELTRQREKLDKERSHYESVLERMRQSGDLAGAAELEQKLAEIKSALRDVEARAANIRAGYVYVISNVGAFGERMVKIGMTRRLEPMDRVHELGGASVPFRFDVHALIFSEDAVGLETRLHQHFADRKVNQVNTRREFFYVTPTEVRDVLQGLSANHLVEFNEQPEALEWRASRRSTGA